jgi:hypothetical protein
MEKCRSTLAVPGVRVPKFPEFWYSFRFRSAGVPVPSSEVLPERRIAGTPGAIELNLVRLTPVLKRSVGGLVLESVRFLKVAVARQKFLESAVSATVSEDTLSDGMTVRQVQIINHYHFGILFSLRADAGRLGPF